MVQTCTKCSRANPPEAVYCYFDGFVLGGHERPGGPVAVGAQRFNNAFVFPSGRTCRSFDELALACQEDRRAPASFLQQGFLVSFLGGLGRLDLAAAAKEAARFPDRDRGLDQLLGKLPSSVLAEPKLRLDPLEVNLGVLAVGTEQTFNLHLDNQGMRLLYGSVTCADGIWLALGEAPGASEKHFQFTHDLTIPVRVRGDRLRAGNKPLEARLLVESNGGTFAAVVRAEVPIKVFPSGVLAGARSPRQVAEKCQANPKEAGPLFEAGEVEKWYAANGWIYPVKVPAASGLAAVQQFFEALGVTKAPKVEISHRSLALSGCVGEQLRQAIEVSSQEKRPVYAHATSNVPWLEVSRTKFNGRVATMILAVPAVPNKPGQTLNGKLTVQANGNQRFVVPVTLTIGAGLEFAEPVAEEGLDFSEPVVAVTAAPPPVPPAPVESLPEPLLVPSPHVRRPARGAPLWMHLVPAALLGLAVLLVVTLDLVLGPSKRPGPGGGGDVVAEGWNYDLNKLRDNKLRLGVSFDDERLRFGLVMLGVKDPRPEFKDKDKRLTYEEDGRSNNTVVKISDSEYQFGKRTPTNDWVRNGRKRPLPKPRTGWTSAMEFRAEKVRVTQHVEIVPSQSRLLDTCLIYYKIENYNTTPQTVGLRAMLDTYIGANDGVPFTVPGRKGFVKTKADFTGSAVPEYIEAVENPDNPKNLGTTVQLRLKGIRLPGLDLEEPETLRICRFPDANIGWDWPAQDIEGDSCVAVYWPSVKMQPGAVRHLAYTYGLGKLDVGDSLALTDPGVVQPNKEFVVTAYVWGARKGQKVVLQLPAGLTLAAGESAEKEVEEDGARTQVFWRVRAGKEGTYKIGAKSGAAKAKPRSVQVKGGASIFG